MKKFGCMMLMLCIFAGMFAGCAEKDGEESLISVEKNGKVQTLDVEEFDSSSYSEEDFRAFAENTVNAYNKTYEEDAVTFASFAAEEGVAKLKLEFKSVEDYSRFMDILLYQGTVAEALAEGFEFDTSFSAVEKGELKERAEKSEILEAAEKLHVVIIGANANVKVPGKIRYVSNEHVTVTAKDTISVYNEEHPALESDVYTYIIYK